MKTVKKNSILNMLLMIMLILVSVSCKKEGRTAEATVDKTEEVLTSEVEKKNDAVKKKAEVKNETKGVLNLTEVDTPPLLDETCKNSKNPLKCSETKIMKFISENIEKPSGLTNEGSFEQVLVVIEKDGSLRNVKYVASSNNEGCDQCQKAAVDVVGKMKSWSPATKDGKPVAVSMTIPVRFI